jgi:hypothetical protein
MGKGPIGLGFQTRFVQPMNAQPNLLDKVGCPTPPMGWVGAPESGLVQPDGQYYWPFLRKLSDVSDYYASISSIIANMITLVREQEKFRGL